MVMEMERTRRLRQRRITSSSSSSSLVMAAAVIAGVALLATCCQADLFPVIGGGSGGGGHDASSSSSRRTRGEGSLLRGGGFDINDNGNSYSAIPAGGVNGNQNKTTPTTFLIKFRDGLAQTRSLEIHHSSRRQQQKQQRRTTRGEDGADEQGQALDHNRRKWQSRAKSISSISDERHIAIVEMMDPEDSYDGENDVAAVTSSTASEMMYDELLADEDVELVEEVRMCSYGA